MNDDQFEKLIGKMDILIKLTALNSLGDKKLKEKVQILYGLGLQPKEIARVLEKSRNNIYVTLHNIKKEEEKSENTTTNSKNE